ncbi:MAG: hypothetical protein HY812_16700 [Planctomycetes bacterium]|nr:hypothetical protein [Planctomycetota bacterium]
MSRGESYPERLAASLGEIRARIAAGRESGAPRAARVVPALEAVTEDFIDLMDRAGWGERATAIAGLPTALERFKALSELIRAEGERLKTAAASPEAAERCAIGAALVEELARVLAEGDEPA